jgi:hypothetical protein
MDTGTVGFVDEKKCFFVKNHPKNKELLKTMEKTRKEVDVDLVAALEDRQNVEVRRVSFEAECRSGRGAGG